ncbi:hypothetical protein B4915_12355 [Leucobacter massiliensis]|uniref:Uncharacterized protein n=1 Tax=Leucobacter massiliensis TaxID=1686285 RepID=A0A2S9QKT2_9MICO|nr:hypothetical protein B4915_12355 [Leucobacter massiliensis]
MVRSAAELIRELESMGLPAFVVGGTLLGARRDGRLLTHDDDADVAYLSAHEHPSDLVTEAHAIEQRLRARGYTLLRHSWSHLQVFFGDPSGEEYYVDIFTAFYKNGYFHEPIHVRARGLDKKIVPVSRLTLHGVDVPAPRNPDAWLVACYGPGWRTPDPAFRFDTPLPTRRRFDGWFSSFDMRREFWESTLQGTGSGQETTLIRDHVIVAAEGTRAVIDLGAGLGADAVFYRDAGLACFASDYAVKPHNSAAPVNAGVEHINLANYTDTASYLLSAFDVVGGASGCVVSANHVLATLDGPTRRTAYELLRLALRGGAQVLVSDYAELGDYRFEDPRTWHLDETTLLRELSPLGLSATTLQMAHHVDRDGVRRPVHVSALVLDDSRTDDERSSTLA